MSFAWMAWTWQTALFFAGVFTAIGAMAVWETVSPGGGPRRGLLRIWTTRGDRLFISLLGAAFIHLGWLGAAGAAHLWGGSVAALLYAAAVFRFV